MALRSIWKCATLQYESAALADQGETMALKVLTDKGEVLRPAFDGGDPVQAFVSEIQEVLASVTANQPSAILSGDLARDAIILCQKQAESVKKGRPINVEPKPARPAPTETPGSEPAMTPLPATVLDPTTIC